MVLEKYLIAFGKLNMSSSVFLQSFVALMQEK